MSVNELLMELTREGTFISIKFLLENLVYVQSDQKRLL